MVLKNQSILQKVLLGGLRKSEVMNKLSVDEEICIIPRNINKPDIIINKPIKLNWKQIGCVSVGAIVSYGIYQTGLPLNFKIASCVVGFLSGVFCAYYKHEGSTVDEIVINSATYLKRKHRYQEMEKRGGLVVTINPKFNETSVTNIQSKIITLQPTKV